MKSRIAGIFFIALGAFGIALGASVLLGTSTTTSGSCKAICGLTLLAAAAFGDSVGQVVGGLLWGAVGAFLCLLGWNVGSFRT